MSNAFYDYYLYTHINNVKAAFKWMTEYHDIFTEEEKESEWFKSLEDLIDSHDDVKYSDEEYFGYADFFYPSSSRPNKSKKQVEESFNYAWLHHIHASGHHWQHWVLINDDPEEGTICLKMPKEYVIEMICDWWSFSLKENRPFEIFSWYDERKAYIMLHPETRAFLEDVLDRMNTTLCRD